MSKVTDLLTERTQRLKISPEVTPNGQAFQMFNDGGVEVEVAELLHSLIRVWKPKVVVETGTHLGISSAYMAAALKEEFEQNGTEGKLTTYEIIPPHKKSAELLWTELGLSQFVECKLQASLTAEVEGPIDFLFLDSEPNLRFDEFVKFFPYVAEGGLIGIHDLNENLGHHGNTWHNVYDWPYGFWQDKLGDYVTDFKVQTLHVPNPRGMTFFQKTRDRDENIRLLKEQG